ncbi:hypothetical protein SPSYN_00701 [Sporotomaculum syntrophicum]|uniref:Radical SAM core domain-containing protein n=1 Tax=Sporotomaculum syntrophicum TaxID=182264 RepID=A0A9D3AZL1_9FIRM|nr:thioether cross-link-forming SCIFF peptide maturase [Sporotomaculum syntrophicum]KAF1085963.1 hypothetical protein SPSYN_00701 [Sporotomaculum syntrophicum]
MIHAFSFDGTNIVLDVNSNAVHEVDEPTLQIIKDYESSSETELINQYSPIYGETIVREIIQEIRDLKNDGLLFSPDPLPEGYLPPEGETVKALCLNLAHDCNLRCRYCFAGQGDFGGQRELMSAEVGRAALDFLMCASGNRQHVEVDFFGGEPLMNRAVLMELVEYGRQQAKQSGKEIKFTLTTNVTLLDQAMQQFIGEHNLAVVLSIDGRPEVHDRMRVTAHGEDSYRRVMDKIVDFTSSPYCREYIVRGTFTRNNLDFCADVKHLAEAGFNHISMEPVVAGAETDYAFKGEDIPALLEEYDKLTRYLLERHQQGRPVDFFHFNIDLEDGPCLPKRLTGCSAGSEYLAVVPGGTLYPCHQFVGRNEFQIGTVFDGVVNKNMAKIFRNAHIYNKNTCLDCWAKFHCSGGCHANAYTFNGDVLKPYHLGCIFARKRLECALYLKIKTRR